MEAPLADYAPCGCEMKAQWGPQESGLSHRNRLLYCWGSSLAGWGSNTPTSSSTTSSPTPASSYEEPQAQRGWTGPPSQRVAKGSGLQDGTPGSWEVASAWKPEAAPGPISTQQAIEANMQQLSRTLPRSWQAQWLYWHPTTKHYGIPNHGNNSSKWKMGKGECILN